MKKICILLAFMLLFCMVSVFAEETVKVTYNGKRITCDVDPYIENSRTLIPVRMAESLGYEVEWDGDERIVTLTKANKTIKLSIGSDEAIVDDELVELDVPAKITSDRTFVPIRFIAENFGYNVDWEDKTRTVLITDINYNKVTEITTEKTGDSLLIKVFSDSVISDVKKMVLEDPVRYIFDIPDSLLTADTEEVSIDSKIVKAVRYSQFSDDPKTVRIVVQLNEKSEVTARYIDGIYTITVTDEAVPTVTSLKMTEEKNSATVTLKTDMKLNYTSYKLSNPSRYVVDLPDSDIAAKDLKGMGDIVEKAMLTRSDGTTRLTVYLKGAVNATKCYISQKGSAIEIRVDKSVVISDSDEEEEKDTEKEPSKENTSSDDFLIVIDPGHGGDEPGSLGKIDDEIVLYEKDINLDIGKRVYEKLLDKGYNVIATRTDDSTVSLMKRVEIANESNADLFVSVHNNSFTDDSAKGTLTMYAYDTPKKGMKFSGKQVAEIIQPYLVKATEGDDRELMENPKIYVNAKTNMPAVLCECLFMSNPDDLEKLLDEDYVEAIAEGITEGIQEAVKQMKGKKNP